MEGKDIANLVIILIFLLSGVVRRLIQPDKGKAPPPKPTRPAPARPQQPRPRAPQQPQPRAPVQPQGRPTELPRPPAAPASASPYVQSLLAQLESFRGHVADLESNAQSPLQHDPRYAPLAKQLLAVIAQPKERVTKLIEETIAGGTSAPVPSTLVITRALEQAEDEIAFARLVLSILKEVEKQRSQRSLRVRLEMLDDLINGLIKSDAVGTANRPLFTLLWQGDIAVPSLVLGPGPVGLAVIRSQDAKSAVGTVALAHGAVLDAIANTPDLRANLREAIMNGPLAGRAAQPPYYARGSFEPITAMACWAPSIAADLVATNLMGASYGRGLIESEWRRGVGRKMATTITPDRGLYHADPPLLIRLAAVDAALHRDGGETTFSAVEQLDAKVQLQGEIHYAMPNGGVRRLKAEPMLDLVRTVSQNLLQKRLPALGEQTLGEILASSLHVSDTASVGVAQRTFLRGDLPDSSPLSMWLGALGAEVEQGDGKTSYLASLGRALAGPAPAIEAARTSVIGSETLLRDAYVLSEII